ncbi:hypothetical protein Q31b_34230 [Novipirellula aureliae]|uniref:Uncharacterized protein n=1 Tax=Novipirellula aureliae TaxID=2527966 RepID=A0A5C6DYU8_9BACT|nr:hypothetical protein [Novipirellula aureliae]TWU40079.1 hypothetical protein Q31b_34230 [Novipirellula aureliae]
MCQIPSILSIQVGLPRVLADEQEWTSGFLKESITEPLWLGTTNLTGDAQADLNAPSQAQPRSGS